MSLDNTKIEITHPVYNALPEFAPVYIYPKTDIPITPSTYEETKTNNTGTIVGSVFGIIIGLLIILLFSLKYKMSLSR